MARADRAARSVDEPESRSVRSIRALGRSATRRARQAHFARAICGGLGALLLTVACATAGGAHVHSPEAWALAAVMGGLAFYTWIRTERIEERDVMVRIDGRLHLGGAFLSAQESAWDTPGSPMTRLAAAKLLTRVRPGQAMEAAIPHTLGFMVLPLVGLLGLTQAIQTSEERASEVNQMTFEVGAVSKNIDAVLEDFASELTDDDRAVLESAKAAADGAAQEAAGRPAVTTTPGASKEARGEDPESTAQGEGAPPEDWRSTLREVAQDLESLSESMPAGSEVAQALGDAAAEAEALGMNLAADETLVIPGDEDTGSLSAFAGPMNAEADAAAMDVASDSQGAALSELAPEAGSIPAPGAEAQGSDATDPTLETAAATEGPRRPDDGSARLEEAPELGPGGSSAAGSTARPRDPESPAAEAVLTTRPWWTARDDGIIRGWLGRRPSGS